MTTTTHDLTLTREDALGALRAYLETLYPILLMVGKGSAFPASWWIVDGEGDEEVLTEAGWWLVHQAAGIARSAAEDLYELEGHLALYGKDPEIEKLVHDTRCTLPLLAAGLGEADKREPRWTTMVIWGAEATTKGLLLRLEEIVAAEKVKEAGS